MALYDLKNRTRAFGESRRLNVGTAVKPRWITNVHAGDDYASSYGNDPSHAIQSGTVIYVGWNSTYGLHVRYRLKSDPQVVVGHHSMHRLTVEVGDAVAPSTLVGYGGKSASGANGNHVHIQAERSGTPIDPRPFIASGLASSGSTNFDNTEDEDMSAEAESRIKAIHDAIFNGGLSMPDGKRSIGQSLADLRSLTAEPIYRDKGDGRGTQGVSVRQDNADTNSMVRSLTGRIAGLESALAAVASGKGNDPVAVREAARAGATEALKSLKFTVEVD